MRWYLDFFAFFYKNSLLSLFTFYLFRSTDTSNYIKLIVYILMSLTFNVDFCSGVFLSQTLESCGIVLQDFQPCTSEEQGNFIHKLLEHLHLNQTRSKTSLIIKTTLSLRDFHPIIFRSMKYNCFFHVHIKFRKDSLFSTISSFKSPSESALYQKALFIILSLSLV